MRSLSFRRVALLPLAALAVAAAPALAAENTEVRRYPVSQPVKRLVVDSESGSVAVLAGNRTHITAVLRWDVTKPTVSHQVRNGVLTVVTRCPQVHDAVPVVGECVVDLTITVPAKTVTDVKASYGEVFVKQMRANQRVDNAFGPVTFDRVTANAITVRSSYGNVSFDRVSAPVITAETSYGAISANVSTRVLTLDTEYAPIRVSVPRGRWAVDTDTSYGRVDINNITVDRRAPRKIRAETSYGDIVINGR